ncbi:MAG TPA: DUF4445 domain-containing protein [Planctomycetaceae bacterium]|nr:DUF4445 domain-containing protein [Planctomycetaceae bacterium]
MRESEIRVTFQPSGKTVHVLKGTSLAEAAGGAGIALEMPCGGQGICGKCRVIVRQGEVAEGPEQAELLTAEELAAGYRLACRAVVEGPLVVEVPAGSVADSAPKILARLEGTQQQAADPPVRKQFVRLPQPSRRDDRPDWDRIRQAAGPVEVDLELLAQLPGRLREQRFAGTLVVAEGRLIDFEPGNTESACYAAAFDLGTTTLVGILLDLCRGRELAGVSRINPQVRFGDDVLSRIQHVWDSDEGLKDLQRAVGEAVDEMIGQLAEQAGVDRRSIYEVTFSGNTTMQQILCGLDPRWLGRVPFVPATSEPIVAKAAELGLGVHPRALAYVMPVIGGFVGGDTVSGLLATGLADRDGPALLVDIGTNGEIVLGLRGRLLAASTAAGPAFEGARILHGMRGTAGAIEKVVVDGVLRINVIGDVPPTGLCGSALIDLGAELLRHGVITPQGRICLPDRLPAETPADLRRRIVTHDGQLAFLLAEAPETSTGSPIVVTQQDIRQLQLATGAIRAGANILMARLGVSPQQLETVFVAGGFGNFIRRKNAQRIGLLPTEVPRRLIRYQGNTSLAGARLVALSARARQLARSLAERAEHVDLSADAQFHQAFAEAMVFPADLG